MKIGSVVCMAGIIATVAACASSTSEGSAGPAVLENGNVHYGKTYAEWGSAWWQWIYSIPQKPGPCTGPDLDPTGDACNINQAGDVFFLAGNRGGNSLRTKCVVPKGKALFFPIIDFTADNGGVPLDKQVSESELQAGAVASLKVMTDLFLEIDGTVIDTTKLRVEPTKYSYTLPPEPNIYSCNGATGVTGLVTPAFHSGYYAMLAPLSNGPHRIHFRGRQADFFLDVTFELQVQ